MASAQQTEVDRNYEAFQQRLPDLLRTNANQFALLRHRRVVDCFDTVADAVRAGKALYDDGVFSVQEVTDRSIDLGHYSHARLLGAL